MTEHAAEHQAIIADMLRWIRQNRMMGAEWYLDEGKGSVVEAPAQAVAGAAANGGRVAPSPSSDSKPQPGQVTDKDLAFRTLCEKFLADTLALIERERQAEARPDRGDPLLTAHDGDATAAMAALRAEVLPCTSCELSESRNSTVFGAGNPQADVVFVGEAPGQDEDRQGQPFVGPSGQLLTKILAAIGFERDDVFICNILKCRPPRNRDPLPVEVQACEGHLKRQLAILKPRVICCLGRVAAQTLLKTDLSLGNLRRTVHFYEGIPVMATFHPAALLRNPGWKRDTWEDVRKLRALNDALRAREA